MARGVMVIAETEEAAQRQILDEWPEMKVLRCRELVLDDLPPLASGPLPKHWVVVVEHQDPKREATLPQHEHPEDHCERETRLTYLTMSVNPLLLATGTIERFACPDCGAEVEVQLPAVPAATGDHNIRCSACATPLTRRSATGSREAIPITNHAPQPCIFCGVVDASHEHVIPRWISKQLGIKDQLVANDALMSPRRISRKQPISFASHRSQCFCDGCNTHFKQLEDSVIPMLVPMARGRTLSLGADSQELIGLWAAKTAIAIVAADRDLQPAITEEHRHSVRNGQIPETAWIAVMRWRGGPLLANAAFTPNRDLNEQSAYAALLAFREIGVFVVGWHSTVSLDVSAAGAIPALREVWPRTQQLLHWPPQLSADRAILPALARIGRVGRRAS